MTYALEIAPENRPRLRFTPADRSHYLACGAVARSLAAAMAEENGYTFADLRSRRRDDVALEHVRQAAYAYVRSLGAYSLPAIGRLFDRHHSTVLDGIRKHKARVGAE